METEGFAQIKLTRKTGNESFCNKNESLQFNLSDFWCWAASDLVSNATRGILAEYIVARALGLNMNVRAEWDAFDLEIARTNKSLDSLKIEVKSASYIQSWPQQKLSAISFGINQTQSWDAATNKRAEARKRQADIYVFCVFGHDKIQPCEKALINPMDVSQWTFYVLPTAVLNERVPGQSTISLSSLCNLNPHEVTYDELADCIQRLAQ